MARTKKPKAAPRPPGRPRLEIDERKVLKLAAIGCTVEEIATVMECSKDTLERRFAAVIEKGRNAMKQSVRRMQFRAAARGSVAMMIWLGKQHLDQTDKREFSGNPDRPVKVIQHMIADDDADRHPERLDSTQIPSTTH